MQSNSKKLINLRSTHPSLLLLYFFSAVIFSMLTLNPAYLMISFLAALLLNISLEGLGKTLGTLRFFIPVHIVIVIANALFSGNGLTVLFYFSGRPVTVESIVYGFSAGLMLLTVLLWFRAYHEVATSDQLLAVGGNRFPLTSLLAGMVLRYVPDTIEHGKTVQMNQKALLGEEKLSRKKNLSFLVRMSSVLMSWSMENAIDTSIAMRAKGYPSDKRNTYKRDRFGRYDAIGIGFLLVMIAIQISAFLIGSYSFIYYPYLMIPSDVPSPALRVTFFVFYAGYLFFPFYLEFMEYWARKKIVKSEKQFGGQRKYGLFLDQDQMKDISKERKMNIINNLKNCNGTKCQTQYRDSSLAAELMDVSFSYSGTNAKALQSLSLSFDRGSLTLLTGPSGSGKTTLLHLLSPVLTPTGDISGSRVIYGKPESAYEETDNAVQIGFVQQNPDNQVILDSVWHELVFGLENQGLSNQEIERRLAETSTFFGISSWMDRKVAELSGGEKQILNLASSLVMQPDLLLLDEPMAQLDPISRKRFLSMLGRVNDETGTTIIISEHIIDDILPHADRVVMLKEGSVCFDGQPEAYVKHLIVSDDEFKVSVPLSARMAAASADENEIKHENLPLTVREGRQYLLKKSGSLNLHEHAHEPFPVDYDPNERKEILRAQDVWFRYEKNAQFVLRGINFSLREGEMHALLGGNGSGKSTLMYILSRSLPVLRGSIKRPENQQVAMLSQNPMAIFSEDSVQAELMAFHERFNYDEEAVDKLMKRFELKHLADRHPYDVSGGEMQKTALAKALLTKPDLLLLDEPVKGLDPVARREVAKILAELKTSGMTMIIVTHDLDFVSLLADRCSMLFDGRVEGIAQTKEFFAGNAYFTTNAHRLSKGIVPSVVTEKELLDSMRSKVLEQNHD